MTFLFILCRNILPVLILFWLFNKRILTFYGEKTVSFLCLESDKAFFRAARGRLYSIIQHIHKQRAQFIFGNRNLCGHRSSGIK